jgi:hypothetical protein
MTSNAKVDSVVHLSHNCPEWNQEWSNDESNVRTDNGPRYIL